MVARANEAAAQAAQRSEEEASHLRRELSALKKEKRELVQRCSSSDREQASLLVCTFLTTTQDLLTGVTP